MDITQDLIDRFAKAGKNSFGQTPMGEVKKAALELAQDPQKLSLVQLKKDHAVDLAVVSAVMIKSRKAGLLSQLQAINPYLDALDTWDLVDTCLSYVHKPIPFEAYLPYSRKLLSDPRAFVRRLGYDVFLKADLADNNQVKKIIPLFKNDPQHTVEMAEGWLMSYICIANPSAALNFFQTSKLKYRLLSIGISKSLDSYRVSDSVKSQLKKIRENIRPQKPRKKEKK
jgi:3-methyladenine DNA glycosylase AlkD